MNKIVVVTFIHPKVLIYINDFLNTINNQTLKDFDIIFFTNNLNEFSPDFNVLNFKVIDLSGDVLGVRIKALMHLSTTDYEKIIFIDADDTMSENRVEIISLKLDNYDVVCNDLNVLDEKGTVLEKNVWRNRLGLEKVINLNFIDDKNIIGFGNTGIKKEILKNEILYFKDLIAADWYVFYQLLYNSNKKFLFTSECQVNYRQHEHNLVGLNNNNNSRILAAHKLQFEALRKCNILILPNNRVDNEFINSKHSKYKENNQKVYPFWWEIR